MTVDRRDGHGSDVITHHDGHGLAEAIEIRWLDDVGPGGAHHRYQFVVNDGGQQTEVGLIQFQQGPRNEPGSTPGVIGVAVIAMLVDQLEAFQAGPYSSRENALAITKLQEAMFWLRERADNRARRGVLGTYQK